MGTCFELSLQRDGVADGFAGSKVMQVLDGDVEDVFERDRQVVPAGDMRGDKACLLYTSIVKSVDSRRFFVFGHPEYDTDTLKLEYERDVKRGINPEIPTNYFPDDDPSRAPLNVWRSQAQLFYTNWLNYYVYQTTPYDLEKVGE